MCLLRTPDQDCLTRPCAYYLTFHNEKLKLSCDYPLTNGQITHPEMDRSLLEKCDVKRKHIQPFETEIGKQVS